MKLFAIGPVEMYERTLKIGGEQVPYFRNQEFSNLVLDTKERLKRLLFARNDDDIVFLTASGTAAMEAVVINCFNEKDEVLVIDGGTFGHRFVEICQLHQIPHVTIKLEDGEVLTEKHLKEAEKQSKSKLTGLLVNAHESSTGQLYNLDMLSNFCKQRNMYFVVDAISSFLADKIDVSKLDIDAVILSSQKALSLAPGLSMVLLSKRIIEDRVNVLVSKTIYLDFKSHLSNGLRGQTPFTPAVRLIYELNDILQMINEIGILNYTKSIEKIAADFRTKAIAIGLEIPTYPLSNAATTIIFPEGGANKTHKILESEYGIVVNPNGGLDADKKFRVGHIGNHTIDENIMIIEAISNILK